jgi:hypothetical protein
MPPAGTKPAIPASKRPQTHASDRVATVIGLFLWLINQLFIYFVNSSGVAEGGGGRRRPRGG